MANYFRHCDLTWEVICFCYPPKEHRPFTSPNTFPSLQNPYGVAFGGMVRVGIGVMLGINVRVGVGVKVNVGVAEGSGGVPTTEK